VVFRPLRLGGKAWPLVVWYGSWLSGPFGTFWQRLLQLIMVLWQLGDDPAFARLGLVAFADKASHHWVNFTR
jgi:hypothetical protein